MARPLAPRYRHRPSAGSCSRSRRSKPCRASAIATHVIVAEAGLDMAASRPFYLRSRSFSSAPFCFTERLPKYISQCPSTTYTSPDLPFRPCHRIGGTLHWLQSVSQSLHFGSPHHPHRHSLLESRQTKNNVVLRLAVPSGIHPSPLCELLPAYSGVEKHP